MAYSIYLRYQF